MSTEIKAADAQQLLDNPRLQAAFKNVRERIVTRLEGVAVGDEAQRTELVISLQVLKAVQQDIKNDIDNWLMENQQN